MTMIRSKTLMMICDTSPDIYRDERAKQLHMTDKKQYVSTYENRKQKNNGCLF